MGLFAPEDTFSLPEAFNRHLICYPTVQSKCQGFGGGDMRLSGEPAQAEREEEWDVTFLMSPLQVQIRLSGEVK